MEAQTVIGGRYRLIELIGMGGMGEVYRATDALAPRGRQIVALKRIMTDAAALHFATLSSMSPDATGGEGLRVALALEFQTLASLRHPNIIRVLDYGFDHAPDTPPDSAPPYLVMDYLEDARGLIDAGRGADFAGKIDLLIQLLGALIYLHRRGILHRDLKPENVLVVGGTTRDDPLHVKVVDFGLAISREASAGASGRAVGTLSYMAPEILAGSAPTEASDLYAVGIMAYELLIGVHPFSAGDTAAFIRQVMRDPPDLTALAALDLPVSASDDSALVIDFSGRADDSTHDAASVIADAPDGNSTAFDPIVYPVPNLDWDTEWRRAADNAAAPLTLVEVIGKLLAKHPRDRYHDAALVLHDLCRAARIPPPAESEAVRDSYLQAARFVGRERELNALIEALGTARAGTGGMWLIGGESGVGKSRLVDELRVRALVQGAFVLRGQAENIRNDARMNFQLWRDPLRRLIATGTHGQTPPDTDDLAALLASDPALHSGRTARKSLGDQVAAALLAHFERLLNAHPPTYPVALLLIEDIQWADESLPVLCALTDAAQTLPLLIVATYRDDETPDLPARLPAAQTITLARFTSVQIARLSAAMLGEDATTLGLRELLERETEGNAFFLVEVVRALAEEAGGLNEVARQRSLPARVLAGGVQQVVRRRLARVIPAARGLLRLAAVMGRIIDAETLEYAASTFGIDLGCADIDAWLIECGNVAVLESIEGKWRFAHDKLREALLDDLSADDARILHRQAAAALEVVHQDHLREFAGVLVGHWRAAGDPERERRYVVDAAAAAYAAQDYLTMQSLYTRALELDAAAIAPDPDTARAHIQLELARAAFHTSAYDLTQAHAATALAHFRAIGDRFNIAEALTLIGEVHMRREALEDAERLFLETLELRRAIDSPVYVAYSLMNLGGVARMRKDSDGARQLWEEALALIDTHGTLTDSARLHNNLGIIADLQGDIERATQYYRRAMTIQRAVKDRTGVARTLINFSALLFDTGDLATARAYLEETLLIARQNGERILQSAALDMLHKIAIQTGDTTGAAHYEREQTMMNDDTITEG
jgi:serine/threonine protein kinase/tetratricopeptide (TPR) repeat protein